MARNDGERIVIRDRLTYADISGRSSIKGGYPSPWPAPGRYPCFGPVSARAYSGIGGGRGGGVSPVIKEAGHTISCGILGVAVHLSQINSLTCPLKFHPETFRQSDLYKTGWRWCSRFTQRIVKKKERNEDFY